MGPRPGKQSSGPNAPVVPPPTLPEETLLPAKPEVIAALLASAELALETAEQAQMIAQTEATSADNRAEGKYDTRATEASYLARGQAERVASMRSLVAWYRRLPPEHASKTVSLGALVAVEGDRIERVLIAPTGGARVMVEGLEIKAISLAAPLGQAMLGLEEGDEFEVRSPSGTQTFEVARLV